MITFFFLFLFNFKSGNSERDGFSPIEKKTKIIRQKDNRARFTKRKRKLLLFIFSEEKERWSGVIKKMKKET